MKRLSMDEATKTIFRILGLLLSIYLLYTAGFGQFSLPIHRGMPLMVVSIMVFLKYPMFKKGSPLRKYRGLLFFETAISLTLILGSMLCTYYIIAYAEDIALRLGSTTSMDIFISVMGILTLFEITRRTSPPALFYLGLAAVGYALLGHYIPGNFGHVGFKLDSILQYLYFSYDGIFGVALGVMVDVVFIFILLGAFLEATGAGRAFIDLAYSLTGRMRGGPAEAAVVSSAMFGTISGSAVANVVGTGTFTIPLMKRTGYPAVYAGAVEAVASTGGMIMPPVMGSAAFIMAEILGVPYIRICKWAILPAILYYLSLFTAVYMRAWNQGLKGLPKEELPDKKRILKETWHLFLALALLIFLLMRAFTPPYAAFFSIIALAVLSWTRKTTRLKLRDFSHALSSAADGSVTIFTSLAYVGVIIGIISMTGLGVKFSALLVELAGSHLLLALILIMFASLVMGMGLPPVACYVILITMGAKALENLGVRIEVAHMFIFYYGTLASITPPVAMAAYAAAGISGADIMKTGWVACRLGLVGFIVPYFFAFGPEILLMGNLRDILVALVSSTTGAVSLAIASEGFFIKKIPVPIRGLMVLGALLLIHVGLLTDLIGYALIALSLLCQIFIVAGYGRKGVTSEVPKLAE